MLTLSGRCTLVPAFEATSPASKPAWSRAAWGAVFQLRL